MPKATSHVTPARKRRNPAIKSLTIEEATAALSALVNGRPDVPPLAELRAMVANRHKPPARRSPAAFLVLAVVVDGGML